MPEGDRGSRLAGRGAARLGRLVRFVLRDVARELDNDRYTRSRLLGIVLLLAVPVTWALEPDKPSLLERLPESVRAAEPSAAAVDTTVGLRQDELFDGDETRLSPRATTVLRDVRTEIGTRPGAQVVIRVGIGAGAATVDDDIRARSRAEALRRHLVDVGGVSTFLVSAHVAELSSWAAADGEDQWADVEITLRGGAP